MMRLNVQLFAVARDWAGRDAVEVELPPGATVGHLRTALEEQFPPMAQAGKRLAIAVNDEYASEQLALAATDSIALIPPVSGG